MTRRKAVPKAGRLIRPSLPDSVSGRDAWDAATADWIIKTNDPLPGAQEVVLQTDSGRPKRVRAVFVPCNCGCYCGAQSCHPSRLCPTCRQGLHHVCSRACRAYPSYSLGTLRDIDMQLTANRVARGEASYVTSRRQSGGSNIVKGDMPAIPPRKACNGGEGWA